MIRPGSLWRPSRRAVIAGAFSLLAARRSRAQFWPGLTSATPQQLCTINVTFGSHVASGAPGGLTGTWATVTVPSVVTFLQQLIQLPIIINLNIDWGFCNGVAMTGGQLGTNRVAGSGLAKSSYATIVSALTANAVTDRAKQALSTLPGTDPMATFGGTGYPLTRAQAKAYGLIASDTTNDAFIGVSDSHASVLAHEITECLGRNNGDQLGIFSVLCLFRYSGNATRAVSAATNTYFSIDGGATDLNDFNGNTLGGDVLDWRMTKPSDAFDAQAAGGAPVSGVDLTLIDAIGYKTNTTVIWTLS